MSGRKSNLSKYSIITAGSMATSLTSAVTNIEWLDNTAFQINFTGSPVGTFQAQVSADYEQDFNGNVINAGNWIAVPLTYFLSGTLTTATTVPTSVGSPIYLDLNQMSAPWIRLVYTRTSGTGTANAFVTGKPI